MKQFFRMDMPNTLVKSESELFEQAVLQRVEVIRNHMLGDFNDDGEYEIDERIQGELLRMHKYLVERYDTQCLIESECIFDKRIYFSLKVEDNLVTFSVLEKMRYGTNHEQKSPYCNIHTTILDQAVLKRKPKNLEELLFKRYNISIADTPTALDVEEMTADEISAYFNTINRKLMVVELERELNAKAELLEEIEKEYYLETIHALKKSGAYGKQVIGEMEQTMITVRPFIDPKKPGYYKGLNQILNAVIHTNRNEENKDQVAEFEERIESPRKKYAEDLQKVVPVVAPPIKTEKERKDRLDELTAAILSHQSQEVKDKQALRQAQKQEQVAQTGKGKGKGKESATEVAAKPETQIQKPGQTTTQKPAQTPVKTAAKTPAPAKTVATPTPKPQAKQTSEEVVESMDETQKSDNVEMLEPNGKEPLTSLNPLIEKMFDANGKVRLSSDIFGKKINNEVNAQNLEEEVRKQFRKKQEKNQKESKNEREQDLFNGGNINERDTGVNFDVEKPLAKSEGDSRNNVGQQNRRQSPQGKGREDLGRSGTR